MKLDGLGVLQQTGILDLHQAADNYGVLIHLGGSGQRRHINFKQKQRH